MFHVNGTNTRKLVIQINFNMNLLLFFLLWYYIKQPLLFLGNGYITTATLREILKELDNKLNEEDLDGIIEEIDEDGSGTVDFDGKSSEIILKKKIKSRTVRTHSN